MHADPWAAEVREARWTCFSAQSRQRFGALVDTGAENNLCGANWLSRFAEAFKLAIMWTESSASFSGVGSGRVPSEYMHHYVGGRSLAYWLEYPYAVLIG